LAASSTSGYPRPWRVDVPASAAAGIARRTGTLYFASNRQTLRFTVRCLSRGAPPSTDRGPRPRRRPRGPAPLRIPAASRVRASWLQRALRLLAAVLPCRQAGAVLHRVSACAPHAEGPE